MSGGIVIACFIFVVAVVFVVAMVFQFIADTKTLRRMRR